MPTYPAFVSSGSPVWMPIRARRGGDEKAASAAPWAGKRSPCGCNGVRRASEGDEERVALGIDLDAVVRLPRAAERRPVQRELGCVGGRADLVEERRRAFHVGEEEGDGAGRTLWHGNRIAPQGSCRKPAPGTESSSLRFVTALLAHAAPISYKFPLPIWLYVLAGGAAVLLSAPAAALAVKESAPEERRGRDVYPSVRWLGRP